MEPVTAFQTIGTAVDLATRVYHFLDDVRNTSTIIEGLYAKTRLLSETLRGVAAFLESQDRDCHPQVAVLENVHQSVQTCNTVLRSIDNYLKGWNRRRFWSKARFVLRLPEIALYTEELDQAIQVLQLSSILLGLSENSRTRERMDSNHAEILAILRNRSGPVDLSNQDDLVAGSDLQLPDFDDAPLVDFGGYEFRGSLDISNAARLDLPITSNIETSRNDGEEPEISPRVSFNDSIQQIFSPTPPSLSEVSTLPTSANSFDASPGHSCSVLTSAILSNGIDKLQAIEALLQSGVDPNCTCRKKRPLFHAIDIKCAQAVDLLLQYGARVDVTYKGVTPLLRAVQKNQEPIVSLLLPRGPNLEVKDQDGLGLLHHAARNGATGILSKLLYQIYVRPGIDLDSRCSRGRTALMYAAELGLDKPAKILLLNKAKSNLKDECNRTALWFALSRPSNHNREQLVALLLEHKAHLARGCPPVRYHYETLKNL